MDIKTSKQRLWSSPAAGAPVVAGLVLLGLLTACGGPSGVAAGAPAPTAPAAATSTTARALPTSTATTRPQAPPTVAPTAQVAGAPSRDLLAEGKLIFEQQAGGIGCAYCHGLDGKGKPEFAAPPNLGKTEAEVRAALETRPQMSMIKLTNDEFKAVVAYLQYLAEQPSSESRVGRPMSSCE